MKRIVSQLTVPLLALLCVSTGMPGMVQFRPSAMPGGGEGLVAQVPSGASEELGAARREGSPEAPSLPGDALADAAIEETSEREAGAARRGPLRIADGTSHPITVPGRVRPALPTVRNQTLIAIEATVLRT